MSIKPESIQDINFLPQSAVFPSPRDWRDQFMYFLLVDRFDNNQENIPAYTRESAPRGRDYSRGGVFQGGNLRGIIRRLDYIKDLGCNAVWISPVFRNRQEQEGSYHGYGIQNFLEVDPRFGSLSDLKELVQEAHRRNMYVILDIILNHTGDNWGYPGDYPYYYWKQAPGPFDFGFWRETDPAPGFQENDSVWPRELQEVGFYKRRGRITNWLDSEEAVDGDFCSLKELDVENPGVLDILIKVYKYWIAAADIDGFRIDTVKHMEDSAVSIFCNAIREYARRIGKDNFFMFGEIVGDDAALQRYIGRNTRIPGTNERFPSLDACLDFPLYFILEEAIKGFGNLDALRARYERFKTMYSDHGSAGRYFVTFVDNHDQMSRPYRRFMHNNTCWQQAVLAMGYLLTSQGIPCIYYGTEQGFDGGGDNDRYVRECMFGGAWGAFDTTGVHFFNNQNCVYQAIGKIAGIRSKEPALRYGRQYFREISEDGNVFFHPAGGRTVLAFSRIIDTEEILVVLNLASHVRNDWITVDRNLTAPGRVMSDILNEGDDITVEEINSRACLRVSTQANQMRILKVK